MRPVHAALAIVAAAALAAPAMAKGPKASELPTLEEIYLQAKAEWEMDLKRAEADRQDPLGETIDNYKDKLISLNEYRQLVDVILDDQDKKLQAYRRPALDAVIERFRKEHLDDPQTRAIRRQIGKALIELMKRSRDELGLQLVEEILFTWWRSKMLELKFRASDNYRDRSRAHRKMKTYLEKDER